MNKEVIILPIKKQWFDMIKSGEKKEEYRDIKPYYRTRFTNKRLLDKWGYTKLNRTAYILFKNGYKASSPSILTKCSLTIGNGKVEWGAEKDKKYYVLHIEEIF